jgi:enoyl-CoA hydratase/carnithine racemase
MASSSHIRVETAPGVSTIVLARPEKKNAFTAAMYVDVVDALHTAAAEPSVRAVVIRGEGGSFTAGNDLKDFAENPPTSTDTPVFQMLELLAEFPKPVLAAVEGVAIGVGTTMLLHCDLVWAAPGTRFRLPFVDLALVPEAASTFLLPRLAGPARANELLFFADFFSPEVAAEIGLINGVVAAESLHAHVAERAATLAAKPPAALRETKALIRAAWGEGISTALHAEVERFAARLQSPEAKEAFAAFFERRAPDFSKFD